jgi:hypothetical protein
MLVPRIAKNAETWQIALCTIIHDGGFAVKLVRRDDGRKDAQRAFDAVVDILRALDATCLPLPPTLESAALAFRSPVATAEALPSPLREHVQAAMRFVGSLVRVKKDGSLLFRIHSTKPRGEKISPWRAGLELAACFEQTMHDRVHDATR